DSVNLSGLARQLVLSNLLEEKVAQQATIQAQRNNLPLVTYLVQNKLIKSRPLAELAADQFGIAYFDLTSLDKDSQAKDAISEKLVRQHLVLPLWKRGNRLFIAASDPTNRPAITGVQFSTGMNAEVILVEDAKLG